MAKKSLPQIDVATAITPSPLSNMINNAEPAATKGETDKMRTSLFLDKQLYRDFKSFCSQHDKKIFVAMEEAIAEYILKYK